MSDIRIGTSGWSHDHWNTVLYEPSLAPTDRLRRYTQEFDTVELNASFYRWPQQPTFRGWSHRLPPGFRMSVKAPRGLSHGRRLYRPEAWTSRLVECWHELGERRGLLLDQLPPDQERDDDRLDYFLRGLPEWMRVAVELRHHSWAVDPVFDLLSRHQATYVVMSGAGLPCVLRATSTTLTCGFMALTMITSTLARTAMPICAGGPTASSSGTDNTLASSLTSTTTDTGTR
jgi:uncharacterized protein YecE (DUF72 family)